MDKQHEEAYVLKIWKSKDIHPLDVHSKEKQIVPLILKNIAHLTVEYLSTR